MAQPSPSPQADDFGLSDCPRCTDAVVDLDEHLTWCKPEGDPLNEARRLIAEHEQQRMQACAAEIEQVLAKYGMRLDVAQPQIAIVPNP